MAIYTLEVGGRAVACIRAESRAEAEDAIADPWFRDGLLGLESEGGAIWNGEGELRLRDATPEELTTVEQRIAAGGQPADIDEAVIYLVDRQARTPADHRLILASRVERTPVFDVAGERIGHIEDLSIDRRTGQVDYAIMSFGGFLGIGKKFHPLPWSVLEYEPKRGGYVVALEKAALETAPYYGPEELWDLGGSSYDVTRRQIAEYYAQYAAPLV